MADNIYTKIFKILIRKIFIIVFVFTLLLLVFFLQGKGNSAVIKTQVKFAPNNISTWIWNTGIFNQDLRTNNTPGFEWPKGSGKTAVFTSGLSIGTFINGQLRLATASYNGEFAPGYVFDSSGIPLFKTDSRFKLLSVRYNDNKYNNPDVIKWKEMIPYGAPFDDVNSNKIYDEGIDKPGMPDAEQTVFFCYTDADPSNHTTSEGFSGGTYPIFAEVHLTAWGYQIGSLTDVQFFKWDVINKSNAIWDKTYFGIFSDADLGDAADDYVGLDTALQMMYCYNSDNYDGNGYLREYGANPPAVGQSFLRSAINRKNGIIDTLKMTSGGRMSKNLTVCESDPSGNPIQAYNNLRGFKKDGTPYLDPTTEPYKTTKFTFTGNPEDSTGWTEYKGQILNCGGLLTGNPQPSNPGDKRMILVSGSDDLAIQHNDTQRIVMSQLIARGTSNKNSVTKLKDLCSFSRRIYYNLIENQETYYSVEPLLLPEYYRLYQNYPNPFNPVTTIKFNMKKLWKVKIEVYDMRGELISTLVDEEKPQGSYEIKFDGSGLPSGIYFVKMTSGSGFEDSKKMVLLK